MRAAERIQRAWRKRRGQLALQSVERTAVLLSRVASLQRHDRMRWLWQDSRQPVLTLLRERLLQVLRV